MAKPSQEMLCADIMRRIPDLSFLIEEEKKELGKSRKELEKLIAMNMTIILDNGPSSGLHVPSADTERLKVRIEHLRQKIETDRTERERLRREARANGCRGV